MQGVDSDDNDSWSLPTVANLRDEFKRRTIAKTREFKQAIEMEILSSFAAGAKRCSVVIPSNVNLTDVTVQLNARGYLTRVEFANPRDGDYNELKISWDPLDSEKIH